MSDMEGDGPSDNGGLLAELVIGTEDRKREATGLVSEPARNSGAEAFSNQLQQTLDETEKHISSFGGETPVDDLGASWRHAREIVTQFQPIPWFIWRVSNYVFSNSDRSPEVSEGLVFGMRRLLVAVASDPLLGCGNKVSDTRQALKVIQSDALAASAVIYAVSRRMGTRQFERIWRPILDDALLRARIGYLVGKNRPDFGGGRGMLAGFAGRIGLAILIASGELEQARAALEMLASGSPLGQVGVKIYDCHPLQISALLLSAAGGGRDAACGIAAFTSSTPLAVVDGYDKAKDWLAALSICEYVRLGMPALVNEEFWEQFGFTLAWQRDELHEEARKAIRRGHGWNWFVG